MSVNQIAEMDKTCNEQKSLKWAAEADWNEMSLVNIASNNLELHCKELNLT